jgi:aerobic carbon-monoxide dehydrogenase medium subunit
VIGSACRYARARTVDEALEALQRDPDAKLIADGVALVALMNQKLFQGESLIDIGGIGALRGIAYDGEGLRIGALVTHSEIESSELVRRDFPILAEMARNIGCGRIRNRGTLGGNLCHGDPQEDPGAALLALDARVRVRSGGNMREIPVRQFFRDSFTTALSAGEILEDVLIPRVVPGAGWEYSKFGPRHAMDYTSTISAAIIVICEGRQQRMMQVELGMSGVGPTQIRPSAAPRVLQDQRPDPDVLARMAETLAGEIDPVSDFQFSADYKRHLAGVIVKRAVERAYLRATAAIEGIR